EDGIRDYKVTGVQTCALPIFNRWSTVPPEEYEAAVRGMRRMVGLFAEFSRRGGRLVTASGLAHVTPGVSIHREMQIMVDAGVERSEERRVGKECRSGGGS